MPTIVTKTIGTGGDYATIPLWFAACPADLVAIDTVWEGHLLKEEHILTAVMDIAGKTVDATRRVHLTAAPGASYMDDVNAATNPFRYDATKGAAIRSTAAAAYTLSLSQGYTKVSKIQIANFTQGTTAYPTVNNNGGAGVHIDQCIIEGYGCNSSLPGVIRMNGNGSRISNSGVFQRKALATAFIGYLSGTEVIGCVLAGIGGVTLNTGIITQYVAAKFINTYIGGVTAPENNVVVAVKTNAYCGVAATGYNVAPMTTVTFANVTDGTHNFRLVEGSALINAGTANAFSVTDAYGQARSGTTDVGAVEFVVVSAPDTRDPVLSVPAATPTSTTTATGTVATDEGGGVLRYLVSTNNVENEAALLAAPSQVVTATGSQNVFLTGLVAGSSRHIHYLHTDAAGNHSLVASSAQFTMPAPDAAVPTFAGGAAITPGTVTTSTLAGSYPAASDNVAVTGYQKSKDSGVTWEDNGSGLTYLFSGLSQGTTYQIWIRAKDAAGNVSVPLQVSMTTTASANGTFLSDEMESSGTLRISQACKWTWFAGGVIGTTLGVATHGVGPTTAAGKVSASVPVGAGYLMVEFPDGGVFFQKGTVA